MLRICHGGTKLYRSAATTTLSFKQSPFPLQFPVVARQRRTFLNFSWSRFSETAAKNSSRASHSSSSSTSSSSSSSDPGLVWTSVLSDPREVPGPRGLPSRAEQLRRLRNTPIYDVLIIGGGATGAGVALDAASRGLVTACLERGDFASETSSRSTKLVWAGLKYLGTATAAFLSVNLVRHPLDTFHAFYDELKMVQSCHRERRYMTSQQPHLCVWVPIVVPFYSWLATPPPMGHPLFTIFPMIAPLLFKFYDALSSFTCPPSYIMTKTTAAERFPQLLLDNLKYCAVFYEAQHNDARTNLAIALTAARHGAHIGNYVQATELIQDQNSEKIIGAKVLDRMTGQTWNVYAKQIVLAAGPFTDELRAMEARVDNNNDDDDSDDSNAPAPAVRGAAGTHIVLPGHFLPPDLGLLDTNTSDGRFLFMLPWLGHTLVGTTDVISSAQTLPDPPEEEIDWLVRECQKYFNKDVTVQRSDVLSAWRGWRPLAVDPHAPADAPVSRDHVISQNPITKVTFIAGGKWTTWRDMAQDVVDRICDNKCRTLDITLVGGDGYTDQLASQLQQEYNLPTDVAERLASTYGTLAWDVCKSGVRHSRLVPNFPYTEDEVVYACREYACTIEDILSRRTRLAFLNQEAAVAAIPRVAELMANELGWTQTVKAAQIRAAERYMESYSGRVPKKNNKTDNANDDDTIR